MTTANKPKAVISCPHCQKSTRVPTDRGRLRVSCPACRQVWIFTPEGSSEYVSFAVTCGTGRGVSLAVFRRGRSGPYRFESAQLAQSDSTLPTTEATRSVDRSQIEVGKVECPICEHPKTGGITCGRCGTFSCWSSVARSEDGRDCWQCPTCGCEQLVSKMPQGEGAVTVNSAVSNMRLTSSSTPKALPDAKTFTAKKLPPPL